VNEHRQTQRLHRLQALAPFEREELVRLIGEAAVDLWTMGEEWPDLVERCLQAVEEEAAAGRVHVRPVSGDASAA